MIETHHLVISGRVQRVRFRNFMVESARALDITGWVRNRTYGTVEAVIAGPPAALEQMIECARRGSAHAIVEEIRITKAAGRLERFEMRPTV